MNRNNVLLAAAALVGFLFAGCADVQNDASKQAKGRPFIVMGTVHQTKDKNGTLEKVRIETDKNKVYWVVLDAKGEEIGNTMDGKRIEATGTLSEKHSEHWLTVEQYTEYQPEN